MLGSQEGGSTREIRWIGWIDDLVTHHLLGHLVDPFHPNLINKDIHKDHKDHNDQLWGL